MRISVVKDGRGGKGRIWKSLLKGIEGRKLEDAGEGLEGLAGFLMEVGIGKIGGAELGAVVFPDPAIKFLKERVVEEQTAFHGGYFLVGKDDALAEAGGTTSVTHAFAEIDAEDLVDGVPRIGEPFLEEGGDGGRFPAFARGYEEEASAGEAEELTVEKVGADGFPEADTGGGNLNEAEGGTGEPGKGHGEKVQVGPTAGEGFLMADEGIGMTDGNDVIMKDARINGVGGLPEKEHTGGIETVEAGEGLDRFKGLAGGETARSLDLRMQGAASIDKEVEAIPRGACEAVVIGGPLVRHGLTTRKGGVNGEMTGIGKNGLKEAEGEGGLDGAVEVGRKICGSEMGSPVAGIAGRSHGAGIGGPHGGGGGGSSEEERIPAGGLPEDG